MPGKVKGLYMWCLKVTSGYDGIEVRDMTSSWKNGLALCALINRFRPDLIDIYSLSPNNIYYNNELAFNIAEKEFGIPKYLDPVDMVTMEAPDRLSMATYLAEFYEYFNDKPMFDPPDMPAGWPKNIAVIPPPSICDKGRDKMVRSTDNSGREFSVKRNERETHKDETQSIIPQDTVEIQQEHDTEIDALYKGNLELLENEDGGPRTFHDVCIEEMESIKTSKRGAVLQAIVSAGITAVATTTIGDDIDSELENEDLTKRDEKQSFTDNDILDKTDLLMKGSDLAVKSDTELIDDQIQDKENSHKECSKGVNTKNDNSCETDNVEDVRSENSRDEISKREAVDSYKFLTRSDSGLGTANSESLKETLKNIDLHQEFINRDNESTGNIVGTALEIDKVEFSEANHNDHDITQETIEVLNNELNTGHFELLNVDIVESKTSESSSSESSLSDNEKDETNIPMTNGVTDSESSSSENEVHMIEKLAAELVEHIFLDLKSNPVLIKELSSELPSILKEVEAGLEENEVEDSKPSEFDVETGIGMKNVAEEFKEHEIEMDIPEHIQVEVKMVHSSIEINIPKEQEIKEKTNTDNQDQVPVEIDDRIEAEKKPCLEIEHISKSVDSIKNNNFNSKIPKLQKDVDDPCNEDDLPLNLSTIDEKSNKKNNTDVVRESPTPDYEKVETPELPCSIECKMAQSSSSSTSSSSSSDTEESSYEENNILTEEKQPKETEKKPEFKIFNVEVTGFDKKPSVRRKSSECNSDSSEEELPVAKLEQNDNICKTYPNRLEIKLQLDTRPHVTTSNTEKLPRDKNMNQLVDMTEQRSSVLSSSSQVSQTSGSSSSSSDSEGEPPALPLVGPPQLEIQTSRNNYLVADVKELDTGDIVTDPAFEAARQVDGGIDQITPAVEECIENGPDMEGVDVLENKAVQQKTSCDETTKDLEIIQADIIKPEVKSRGDLSSESDGEDAWHKVDSEKDVKAERITQDPLSAQSEENKKMDILPVVVLNTDVKVKADELSTSSTSTSSSFSSSGSDDDRLETGDKDVPALEKHQQGTVLGQYNESLLANIKKSSVDKDSKKQEVTKIVPASEIIKETLSADDQHDSVKSEQVFEKESSFPSVKVRTENKRKSITSDSSSENDSSSTSSESDNKLKTAELESSSKGEQEVPVEENISVRKTMPVYNMINTVSRSNKGMVGADILELEKGEGKSDEKANKDRRKVIANPAKPADVKLEWSSKVVEPVESSKLTVKNTQAPVFAKVDRDLMKKAAEFSKKMAESVNTRLEDETHTWNANMRKDQKKEADHISKDVSISVNVKPEDDHDKQSLSNEDHHGSSTPNSSEVDQKKARRLEIFKTLQFSTRPTKKKFEGLDETYGSSDSDSDFRNKLQMFARKSSSNVEPESAMLRHSPSQDVNYRGKVSSPFLQSPTSPTVDQIDYRRSFLLSPTSPTDVQKHLKKLHDSLPEHPAPGSVAEYIRKISQGSMPRQVEKPKRPVSEIYLRPGERYYVHQPQKSHHIPDGSVDKKIENNVPLTGRSKSSVTSYQEVVKKQEIRPSSIFSGRPVNRRHTFQDRRLAVRPASIELKNKVVEDEIKLSKEESKPPIPPPRKHRKTQKRLNIEIKPLEEKPRVTGESCIENLDRRRDSESNELKRQDILKTKVDVEVMALEKQPSQSDEENQKEEKEHEVKRRESLKRGQSPRRSLSLSSPTRPEVFDKGGERNRNVWQGQVGKPPSPKVSRSNSFEVKVRPVSMQLSADEKIMAKQEMEVQRRNSMNSNPSSRPPTPTKNQPKLPLMVKPLSAQELTDSSCVSSTSSSVVQSPDDPNKVLISERQTQSKVDILNTKPPKGNKKSSILSIVKNITKPKANETDEKPVIIDSKVILEEVKGTEITPVVAAVSTTENSKDLNDLVKGPVPSLHVVVSTDGNSIDCKSVSELEGQIILANQHNKTLDENKADEVVDLSFVRPQVDFKQVQDSDPKQDTSKKEEIKKSPSFKEEREEMIKKCNSIFGSRVKPLKQDPQPPQAQSNLVTEKKVDINLADAKPTIELSASILSKDSTASVDKFKSDDSSSRSSSSSSGSSSSSSSPKVTPKQVWKEDNVNKNSSNVSKYENFESSGPEYLKNEKSSSAKTSEDELMKEKPSTLVSSPSSNASAEIDKVELKEGLKSIIKDLENEMNVVNINPVKDCPDSPGYVIIEGNEDGSSTDTDYEDKQGIQMEYARLLNAESFDDNESNHASIEATSEGQNKHLDETDHTPIQDGDSNICGKEPKPVAKEMKKKKDKKDKKKKKKRKKSSESSSSESSEDSETETDDDDKTNGAKEQGGGQNYDNPDSDKDKEKDVKKDNVNDQNRKSSNGSKSQTTDASEAHVISIDIPDEVVCLFDNQGQSVHLLNAGQENNDFDITVPEESLQVEVQYDDRDYHGDTELSDADEETENKMQTIDILLESKNKSASDNDSENDVVEKKGKTELHGRELENEISDQKQKERNLRTTKKYSHSASSTNSESESDIHESKAEESLKVSTREIVTRRASSETTNSDSSSSQSESSESLPDRELDIETAVTESEIIHNQEFSDTETAALKMEPQLTVEVEHIDKFADDKSKKESLVNIESIETSLDKDLEMIPEAKTEIKRISSISSESSVNETDRVEVQTPLEADDIEITINYDANEDELLKTVIEDAEPFRAPLLEHAIKTGSFDEPVIDKDIDQLDFEYKLEDGFREVKNLVDNTEAPIVMFSENSCRSSSSESGELKNSCDVESPEVNNSDLSESSDTDSLQSDKDRKHSSTSSSSTCSSDTDTLDVIDLDPKVTDSPQYLLPECNKICTDFETLQKDNTLYIPDILHHPSLVEIQVFVIPDRPMDSKFYPSLKDPDIFLPIDTLKDEDVIQVKEEVIIPLEPVVVTESEVVSNKPEDDLHEFDRESMHLSDESLETTKEMEHVDYTPDDMEPIKLERVLVSDSEDELLKNIILENVMNLNPIQRRKSSTSSISSDDIKIKNTSYHDEADSDTDLKKRVDDFDELIPLEEVTVVENAVQSKEKLPSKVHTYENVAIVKQPGSKSVVVVKPPSSEISLSRNVNSDSEEFNQNVINESIKIGSRSRSSSSSSSVDLEILGISAVEIENNYFVVSDANKLVEHKSGSSSSTSSDSSDSEDSHDVDEDVEFLIGREKDPTKSEVARLIQQSLAIDKRREELRKQEQDRLKVEQELHDQFKPRDEVLEHEHIRHLSESHMSEASSKEEEVDLDESSGEEEDVEEQEVENSEDLQGGEATPLSMPSNVDSDNTDSSPDDMDSKPVVEVFDLQESSPDDISPDMEAQALFVKLKEAQCKNAVLEAEITKLKAKLVVLENNEAQRKLQEKKNEEMAGRLREMEKSLNNARKEINHYQDLMEGSQGQYIALEKKLKAEYTALEKKYHKAKKLIKEYQQREKDLIAGHESLIQQQTEKDQQYDALVKSLKDRIFHLESELSEAQRAAGLPVLLPTQDRTHPVVENVVIPSISQPVKSAPKFYDSGSPVVSPVADKDEISSESDISSVDAPSPRVRKGDGSEGVLMFESVPAPKLLDTSISKAKAQLAASSPRRPPTKQRSKSQDSEELMEETSANNTESGLETWIKHDSDNTVKKSDVRKWKAEHNDTQTPPPVSETPPLDTKGRPHEYEAPPSLVSVPAPPPPPSGLPETSYQSEELEMPRDRLNSESGDSSSTVSQTSYDPSRPTFRNKDSEIPGLDSASIDTTETNDTCETSESSTSAAATKRSKGILPKLPFKFGSSDRDKGGGVMLVSQRSINSDDAFSTGEGGITLISKKKIDTGLDFDGASTISDTSSGYMVGEVDQTSYNFSGTLGNDQDHPSLPGHHSLNQFSSGQIGEWNNENVRHWLIGIEMEKYAQLFTEKSVTGPQLVALDSNKLKALGVTNAKDRDYLKKKVKELKLVLEKERKQMERDRKQMEKEQKQREKEQKKMSKKK